MAPADRSPPLAFIETAILYQSGLDRMVDEAWLVEAPEEIRVDRVCSRDNTTPEAVGHRIASQTAETAKLQNTPAPPLRTSTLLNDNSHSLLLQIAALLNKP